MKRIFFVILILFVTNLTYGQLIFDLGLKGGIHTSTLKVKEGDLLTDNGINLGSESITKMHFGAFGRLGVGRLYVQPEVYYSKKGGQLSNNLLDLVGNIDYKNVDVPVLLGYKIIKGSVVDLKVMAGPVFSFITDANYPNELDPYLHDEFFNEHLMAFQYGLGIDVLFLTFDARVEHGSKFYEDPSVVTGKNTTFMFSVGFKIL